MERTVPEPGANRQHWQAEQDGDQHAAIDEAEAKRRRDSYGFRASTLPDGSVIVDGTLPAELGKLTDLELLCVAPLCVTAAMAGVSALRAYALR